MPQSDFLLVGRSLAGVEYSRSFFCFNFSDMIGINFRNNEYRAGGFRSHAAQVAPWAGGAGRECKCGGRGNVPAVVRGPQTPN